MLCAIVALSSLLSAWIFYIPGREYNVIENSLYSSLHRITWSAAMSWLIIAGGTTGFGMFYFYYNFTSPPPILYANYTVCFEKKSLRLIIFVVYSEQHNLLG